MVARGGDSYAERVSADTRPGGASDHEYEIARIRKGARRMAWLYAAAAVFLVPWIIFLAVTLPGRDIDRHYNLAWVGFDVLLVFAISRTAWYAFHIDPRVQIPAAASATLLIVDAWFDMTTSADRNQFLEAALMAVCIEIPAALFSLYLVRRVNRRLSDLAEFELLIQARSLPPRGNAPRIDSDGDGGDAGHDLV